MSNELTRQGIAAYQAGDRLHAQRFLASAVLQNPRNEAAWFYLSKVVDQEDQKRDCLQRVLSINPGNTAARIELNTLSPAPTVPDYLPHYLTPQQREAVLHEDSPLLVIAGPGSGKTEVISWRVAHLVRSGRVQPENVLAVTFTEKAAQGLKDRIQQKLPNINVELMQISTLHSFAALLLRRFATSSPLPRGFRILDETGQFLLVYSNRKPLGLDEIVKGRPQDFFAAVLRMFNLATEELVDPGDLEYWCEENGAACSEKEAGLWKERRVVCEAYRRYCQALQEESLVDFAFLQRHAVRLLEENPEIREELRRQYPEILVDEYQDTNAAQERLVSLLAGDGKHLTVVGDDDQGIYRFRGATVKNILSFSNRYPGARFIQLLHNFRSRDPIVNHSLQVIDQNPARFPKELQAVRGPGSEVLLVYEHSAAEEAAAIAQLIQRLHAARQIGRYADVVILLRSVKSFAGPYVEALSSLEIPSQVVGDASLFEREEILQLYYLVNFLGTEKAWGDNHLRNPFVGFSDETCQALKGYQSSLYELAGNEQSLEDIGVKDPSDRRRLLLLLDLKRRVLAQEHGSALQIFYDLLSTTGCVVRFEQAGDSTSISNLGILSRLFAAWDEHGSSGNFYPFREYLKLLKDSGADPVLPVVEDAVRIMTIHQAKGLEFPVVVLGAAMDGRLPSARRADPYEIPYTLRASGEPEVDDPHLVDERKLFYVAATRARDLLIIGTADVVNKRGGGPSPFLYEMFGTDLITATVISDEKIKDIESRPLKNEGPRPRHSFSQLAYYLQCPVRYKFAVVYGLEVPWLDPVDFGANVHRCLEAIHQRAMQGAPVDVAELPELVAAHWLSPRRSERQPVLLQQEQRYQRAAVEQLSRYLQGHGERLAQTVQAETVFSFPMEEAVLSGKIDLIRKSREGVEIVDFKTSTAMNEELERAALQLGLYALGVESSLGLPVAINTAHFLGDGLIIRWEWNTNSQAQAKKELKDLLGRIRRMEFPPRRTYCPLCSEFRPICPYYSLNDNR